MPHTSHRKNKQRNKRAEITDEDGWTRVTSTNVSQRRPKPLPAQISIEKRCAEIDELNPQAFAPSDAPADKTVDELEKHYRIVEKRWLDSQSYKELERCLREIVDNGILTDVDNCLVFGTGSFCGHVRGWIERFEVSMFQLAAFISVINTINSITGALAPAQAYAQEPTYNNLDIDLLTRLNIMTVKTPVGFKRITPQSFVYTPNSELDVELRTLACNPAIAMVHSKLDMFWRNEKGEACTSMILVNVKPDSPDEENGSTNDDGFKLLHDLTEEERQAHGGTDRLKDEIEEGLEICEGFKRDKDVQCLPSLDAKDEPFYQVHLYHRRPQGDPAESDGLDKSRL